MSKRSVGTVLSSRYTDTHGWSNMDGFWVSQVENLNGDIIEFFENMILTEDQFNDAKTLL